MGVALVLTVLGGVLIPAAAEQGRQFLDQLPPLLMNLRGWLGVLARLDREWAIPVPAVEGLDQTGLAV